MRCLGPMLSAEPISIIHLFLRVTSEFYPCHLLILLYLVKFTWAPLSILHSFICTISIYCLLLYQVIFGLVTVSPSHSFCAFYTSSLSHLLFNLSGTLSHKHFLWHSCSFHSGAFSNATCQGTLSWLFCTK